jgi:hypothetical protein
MPATRSSIRTPACRGRLWRVRRNTAVARIFSIAARFTILYLGDDPDPFIRAMIQRDLGIKYGGEQ